MSKPLTGSLTMVSATPPGPAQAGVAAPALMGNYARQDVVFERGEGSWLITPEGARYLDFGSGVAVNVLGHAHPRLVAALKEQAEKLWHTSNLYRVAGQEKLSAKLAAATFADKVFFCNSGAEACEGVIKTARRYFSSFRDIQSAIEIITFQGLLSTGARWRPWRLPATTKYLEGFGPARSGLRRPTDLGDRAAVEGRDQAVETAAIMIEPVQGEGGVRTIPAASSSAALRADQPTKHGLLAACSTRCRRAWAARASCSRYEWAGITPDVMAVAKGIGGGFPDRRGAGNRRKLSRRRMTAGSARLDVRRQSTGHRRRQRPCSMP